MAVIGRIIRETENRIQIRPGDVLCDVIIEKNWMQIRTYKSNDNDRMDGAKQNFQIDKKRARQLRDLLDEFINQ